jgi:hypothetical protein
MGDKCGAASKARSEEAAAERPEEGRCCPAAARQATGGQELGRRGWRMGDKCRAASKACCEEAAAERSEGSSSACCSRGCVCICGRCYPAAARQAAAGRELGQRGRQMGDGRGAAGKASSEEQEGSSSGACCIRGRCYRAAARPAAGGQELGR